MRRLLLLSVAIIAFVAAKAQTVITITDADLQPNQTYNWTKDNIYLLDGFVFVDSGATLNIEAGTIIQAKETPTTGDNASALIVAVTAQIFATGTAAEPIIFTSELDDVNDNSDLDETDRGLWGGLILLGNGVLGNNTPITGIEGIPVSETRALYGGNDDANNVGTLQYVSIRHGGAQLSPGDEINGLTLGGIGSGTTLEHIEVFANSDDGVEFFGGMPNVKWCITAFCGDDSYDWDTGFRGKGQYWLAVQATDAADNGAEQDGAKPDDNARFAAPTIYNATYIGGGASTPIQGDFANTNALLFRDGTGGYYGNSIFTDYAQKAIEVEDLEASKGVDSRQRMEDGDLSLENNLWFGFGNFTTLDADPSTGIIRFTPGGEDTTCQFLISHLAGNGNQLVDPQLRGISRTAGSGGLDPRPQAAEATTGLAAYPAGDAFFDNAGFKGAFNPAFSTTWAHGWTALDAYGYLATPTGINELTEAGFALNQNQPNPAEGSTVITFELPQSADITIYVTDIMGRIVKNITAGAFAAGIHNTTINVADLQAGIYFYTMAVENGQITKKMIVQ